LKRVAIIGSHGLYANYGGWDQLVKNLAERKSDEVNYIIFNSSDSAKSDRVPPSGVTVKRLKFKASGFEGLFYDFWSILLCYYSVDTILFLGVQGLPLIPILRIFKRIKIVSNVGGIEWERPKFGFFSKTYLKLCFRLAFICSDTVVLDNEYYKIYTPDKVKSGTKIIPYGGEIDTSLSIDEEIKKKYPFITSDYFLSVSRSLEDNMIDELCESFVGSKHSLVLISNLTNSYYGKSILAKYSKYPNIVLINGLYFKPELDLIRRKCKAYIHTHTLCGTAPSLVEMIITGVPILSIDKPQNRFTLYETAFFFSSFIELQKLIDKEIDLSDYIPGIIIRECYNWPRIIEQYESLY